MHVNVIGLLFLLAGICGLAPVDGRAAWALVLIAGILMLVGM